MRGRRPQDDACQRELKHWCPAASPAPARSGLARARRVGALVALVTPPIVGACSDRCASRWGRRRPYMAAGVAVNPLGLLLMWTAGNRASFWVLLGAYLGGQLGRH